MTVRDEPFLNACINVYMREDIQLENRVLGHKAYAFLNVMV